MKTISFFPKTEPEKRQWLASMRTNIFTFGQNLNIDPRELQELEQDAALSIADIDDVYQKSSDLDAAIQRRNANREIFLKKLSLFMQRAKINPLYTDAQGETVNIVTTPASGTKSAKISTDINKLKVDIKVSRQRVAFKFARPVLHLVAVYCRRATETDYTLVTRLSGATFEDLRPNLNNTDSEKRDYCFTLSKNDKESERSAVHSLAVAQ
jgi:hypothetical protein